MRLNQGKNIKMSVLVDQNAGFSKNGNIPFQDDAYTESFDKFTSKSIVVMGRRTYENILSERSKKWIESEDEKNILDGKESVVITGDEEYSVHGALRLKNFNEVLIKYKNDDRDICVIGGYRLFVEALSCNPTIHMGILREEENYGCDLKFPIEALELKNYKINSGIQYDSSWIITYEN